MNFNSYDNDNVIAIHPPNLGWLQKKLKKEEIDFLWKCIENREKSVKDELAGNINESNLLVDENNWFFNNTLLELCSLYEREFSNLGKNVACTNKHPFTLNNFWVNFQKQNEFNPLHNHAGIYRFVVWMKIPTRHDEQNKNQISSTSNSPRISTFNLHYYNILGDLFDFVYEMYPEAEETLLFFPSQLNHVVYPFFNCEEDRISISGNLYANSSIILE